MLRAIIAQHPLPPPFSLVHLNISLCRHFLRAGVRQHQVNHRALPQPLLLSLRPHLLCTEASSQALSGPSFSSCSALRPNPWQLFQILSIFLRAATASHPPRSCSGDDPLLLLRSWARLSKHSSHSNPSAHLSQVPSRTAQAKL